MQALNSDKAALYGASYTRTRGTGIMLRYSYSDKRYDFYIENGKRITILKRSPEGRELYRKSGRAAENRHFWKATSLPKRNL
jgi:hypothetical protein